MNSEKHINSYIINLLETIKSIKVEEIEKVIQIIVNTRNTEKTIFLLGNGGSASTASHIASDINKGMRNEKQIFRAIALTDNMATIMAYANDMSYEDVFIEQLKNFIKPNDVVIALSGSGNSKNVIKAVEYANKQDAITIGLTGYDGGVLKKISKYSINANVDDMEMSEDIHLIVFHIIKRALMLN